MKCLTGSGEGGIRTLDRVAPITVFETAAFNHSATSPLVSKYYDFYFIERYYNGKDKRPMYTTKYLQVY